MSLIPNAEKMLHLWGPGANGKSQILWRLRGLLGDDACVELPLPDLRNQASLELLIGKLAMIGGEANRVELALGKLVRPELKQPDKLLHRVALRDGA